MCSKKTPIKCVVVQDVALKRWELLWTSRWARSLNKSSVLIPPHNPGIPAAVSYTAQRAAKTLIMSKSANNSQFLYSNRILFFLQLSSVGMFEQEFTTTLILSSILCTSVPRECPPPPARRARVTQTAYSDWCWQKLNLDNLFNSSHYLKKPATKNKVGALWSGTGGRDVVSLPQRITFNCFWFRIHVNFAALICKVLFNLTVEYYYITKS